MKNIQRMKGFSVINFLIGSMILVFVLIIAIRLIPPYMTNYSVKDAMKSLAAMPDITHYSKAKLKDAFSRKLQASYVTGVPLDALTITERDKKHGLAMKYELRVHVMGNVDAVLMFDEEVPVGE